MTLTCSGRLLHDRLLYGEREPKSAPLPDGRQPTQSRHSHRSIAVVQPRESGHRPARETCATAALDRFHDLNTQLIVLSRRNSNVRSLALSLGKKRVLTARCEENLHAIQDALSKRAFAGTR